MVALNICKEKKLYSVLVTLLVLSLSLTDSEYFILFSAWKSLQSLIELFLAWYFMQNGIINIKMINIVTLEMMCFDHTLTVAKHFFKILSNVVITLYSHAHTDMGHMGWHLKRWKPTNSPTIVFDINYKGTPVFCLWWMNGRDISKAILIFAFHLHMRQSFNEFLDHGSHS